MDVGAPFMTPGAGTARPVRGIARGGVCDVSGQLRRCDGYPGDTSVAPTFWRRYPAALRRLARGDGRRGAIYDARCRHGTTRPRHCSRRCTRRFQPIAALRRSSGRHKCRPYVLAAVSCGVATVFRATQVSPLRLAAVSCGVATVIRATQVSPLRWAAASCGVATVFRATQVSPLRLAACVAVTLSADALKLSAGLFFLSQ